MFKTLLEGKLLIKNCKKLLIDLYKLRKELAGRFLINPHTSYYSDESYKEMRTLATKNGLKILHNKPPLNRII